MDLVVCIIFHYLAQLSVSNNVTLPNHLSQLLNKLIKETENKSDNKTTFQVIEPGNASKIVYIKEKTNPKMIWQVKYEDITDKHIEDEKKKTNLFQDLIHQKNINRDVNVMNPISNNQKNIPNSLEYISEYIVDHTTLKDLSPVNEEITTETSKNIGSFRYADILDEITSDRSNIKNYKNILYNLTKLISSKNSNDTLNMIYLNKNYDRLLKEIQEIKMLHKNENLKDKIILSQPLLTHGTASRRFAYPSPLLPNYRPLPHVGASSTKQIIPQIPLYRKQLTNYVPALVKKSILTNYHKGSTFTSHVHHVTRP